MKVEFDQFTKNSVLFVYSSKLTKLNNLQQLLMGNSVTIFPEIYKK